MDFVASLCDPVIVMAEGACSRRATSRDRRRSARAGGLYGAPRVSLLAVTASSAATARRRDPQGHLLAPARRPIVASSARTAPASPRCSRPSPASGRSGSVRLDGRPHRPAAARHRGAGVAFVPQEANIFPSLTVRENLEMGGYLEPAPGPRAHGGAVHPLPHPGGEAPPRRPHAVGRAAPDPRHGDGADGAPKRCCWTSPPPGSAEGGRVAVRRHRRDPRRRRRHPDGRAERAGGARHRRGTCPGRGATPRGRAPSSPPTRSAPPVPRWLTAVSNARGGTTMTDRTTPRLR